MDFSPLEALEFARRGEIERWVHQFLLTVGRNPAFSDGLKKARRWWAGPLMVPLERLVPALAPLPDAEYPVNPEAFEKRLAQMIESLASGWLPPPMIAEHRDGGILSLRDGNHRYEVLRRAGHNAYWTIIWFNSQVDHDAFSAESPPLVES